MNTANTAKVRIINDYDNFFGSWANELAQELSKLSSSSSIQEITVNSGPYRSYGMSYNLKDNVLHLDFYSAARMGFGSIGCTPKELAEELCK
jgi:hypothetical protein